MRKTCLALALLCGLPALASAQSPVTIRYNISARNGPRKAFRQAAGCNLPRLLARYPRSIAQHCRPRYRFTNQTPPHV